MVASFPLSPKGPRSRSSNVGRQERMGIPAPEEGIGPSCLLFRLGLRWPG